MCLVHARSEVASVLRRSAEGAGASQISRELGIPRRTVGDWLAGSLPTFERRAGRSPASFVLTPEQHSAYAYVLGMYLGDGDISPAVRSFRLRVSLDSRYPRIVAETATAIRRMFPDQAVGTYRHPTWNMVRVSSYSRHWPELLPQHARGPKHLRSIELRKWQMEITRAHARELVRGLIHSDGCRFIARQKAPRGGVYRYPRYSFRNYSEGIIAIFCAHLDLLGIGWTLASRETVQVARRAEVAKLDEFVGPKR